MKKIIIIFLLIPTLALSETFKDEEGKFGLKTKGSGFKFHKNFMDHNDYNFQYIKDKTKARAGKYFQRFELRDGDCFRDDFWSDCDTDRERVEFSTKPRQAPKGKQCYGFSLMLSKDFFDVAPASTTLGQVHQIGGPTGTASGGLASFPPLIQIDAYKGYLFFNWHELSGSATDVIDKSVYTTLKPLRKMKEVWTDISFCLDFKNKRIDAWVDGIKKVEILKSPIFFKPEGIYFKHGIYRNLISKYKELKNRKMRTQVVFYDEVRRGNSIKEVDININPNLKPVD